MEGFTPAVFIEACCKVTVTQNKAILRLWQPDNDRPMRTDHIRVVGFSLFLSSFILRMILFIPKIANEEDGGRPTNVGKIVNIRVIERAVESDPRPGRGCSEVKTDSFKPPLSRGDKGGSNGFPGGESLHGHGSMAAVAGVADGEGEGVAPVGACSDDLGNGGFSPSDQFHGGAASGD
nr:hypothetical protein Itr_chr10CG03120 [Ipomoea trifida]